MIMVFEEHPFDGSAKKCESAMNTKSLSNHSDISAGFVIFYTPERALIMKLDGVASLITDPTPTSFTFVQNSIIENSYT